jgi:hypothetical protein
MENQLILNKLSPFPYLEIENMYNDEELKLIWQELEFLNRPNKFKGPKETGSAIRNNQPLKKNTGIYLDNVYLDRKISNILILNKKIFEPIILESFSSLFFLYENIKCTNFDSTLISYYENDDYYEPHKDDALYTCLTWFFKEPKKFKGGDFYFSDFDLKVNIKNNKTIIFPSSITHSVDKVSMEEDVPFGYGRYVMVQMLYIMPKTYFSDNNNK